GPLHVDTARPSAYDAVFFVTPNATDDGVRIEGAPGRQRLTESQAARQIIERFATRAFRRPVRRDESAALMQLYRESREYGDSYGEAVKLMLTAALGSPTSLYRSVEPPDRYDPASVPRLRGFELARR